MNEKELREWGRQWYPCTTNMQSLRWLYEFPREMKRIQDELWEQLQAQKGTNHVVH